MQGIDPKARIGVEIFKYALSQDVLLRPMGHVVYFMPPYVITIEEIDIMMDVAFDAIKNLYS